MNLAHPYGFDPLGRTAASDDDRHVRDLIEQVLFTSPGERVNRPDFGSGLLRLAFAPNSPELAATTQLLVQGALQQWLGEWIHVEAVEVRCEEALLRVRVRYAVRRTQERRQEDFARKTP